MIGTFITVICFFYFYKLVYQRLLNQILPEDDRDSTVKHSPAK